MDSLGLSMGEEGKSMGRGKMGRGGFEEEGGSLDIRGKKSGTGKEKGGDGGRDVVEGVDGAVLGL